MPTRKEFLNQLRNELAQKTQQQFFETYRELVAFFDSEKVFQSIVSYLQLNHGDELPEIEPVRYRQLLAEALVTLFDRGAVVPVATLNVLAHADLQRLRKETGIGYVAPPPTPRQSTAEELLEQRVSNDWNFLKVADFKKNCANDKAYRETFERLSAESRLGGNTATSLFRAGA
jgi:hypothetical protein